MNCRCLFLTLFVAGLHQAAPAAEPVPAVHDHWHQWRGPLATGVSPTANPPLHWSATQNLRWKAEIPGQGKSSPIVWGNRVYLTTAINTGSVVAGTTRPEDQPQRQFGIKFPNTLYRFVVLCLNRETGEVVWERTAVEELPHEGHHGDNSFASASPFTDGRRLYVSFGSRGLYCYDLDGTLKWKKGLENVSTRLSFGEASSPVVSQGILILTRDNETRSQILALNADTGETVWEAPREEVSAWATPLIVEHGGKTHVVTNASRRVRSYDLKTGAILWECGGQVANVTPCPVEFNDTVICMSGYRGSAALSISLDSQGDVTGSDKIRWKFDRDTPYVPSPLLYEGLLYFNKLNNGILTCLDAATGQPRLSASRLEGISNIYASPVAAAGRIYFVARDGTTSVLKAGSELQVLATNRLDDLMDASPALAGTQLFLRGQKHLYCLESP